MNDVAYRINTALPVKAGGTMIVAACPASSGCFLKYTAQERIYPNETAATGLVNKFDETTYYTA